jgi:hypothetical protein
MAPRTGECAMSDRNDGIRITRVNADIAREVADLTAPSADVGADVLEVSISDSTSAATLEAISNEAERQNLGLRLKVSDTED